MLCPGNLHGHKTIKFGVACLPHLSKATDSQTLHQLKLRDSSTAVPSIEQRLIVY